MPPMLRFLLREAWSYSLPILVLGTLLVVGVIGEFHLLDELGRWVALVMGR